ncbi:GlcG/HbpS family heme-binding protein [Pseudoduganella violaceinigra]|uniref:GlcG/HbpS family heme-binding protein n=1 Tax=Pseudoduganella violaceinigra TaxID=246602 RepID=UPI0004107CC3|nr:heme-binding protein [Pseudoduganella violaceinigra]
MLRTALLCLMMTALPLASHAAPLNAQLTQRTVMNLSVIKQIAAAAEAEARKNNWNVSIAIVDEGGQLVHFIRMDDSPNSSVMVSQGKARHAANYRRDTKFHQEVLEKGNIAALALPDSLPIEGGVRLVADGKVIGAIGVSGVQAAQDAQIARAGAALLKE